MVMSEEGLKGAKRGGAGSVWRVCVCVGASGLHLWKQGGVSPLLSIFRREHAHRGSGALLWHPK